MSWTPGGVSSANFASTPEIAFGPHPGGGGRGNTAIVGLYGAANVTFQGAVLNNCSLGLLRANGSYACTVRSVGTRLLGLQRLDHRADRDAELHRAV